MKEQSRLTHPKAVAGEGERADWSILKTRACFAIWANITQGLGEASICAWQPAKGSRGSALLLFTVRQSELCAKTCRHPSGCNGAVPM
ncbi:MAG: hypothetical protein ACRD28_10470, partial [Acidobacteriaceae bacterium]